MKKPILSSYFSFMELIHEINIHNPRSFISLLVFIYFIIHYWFFYDDWMANNDYEFQNSKWYLSRANLSWLGYYILRI